ncbi:hypothetical protein ACIF83_36460 [Streptomyces sp. NPDC085866]|uniref:hypothetical protein n=1 Tax=Streptomyces sp. NPDC085866 TaxID=3365736 RepID=UPI0037D6D217
MTATRLVSFFLNFPFPIRAICTIGYMQAMCPAWRDPSKLFHAAYGSAFTGLPYDVWNCRGGEYGPLGRQGHEQLDVLTQTVDRLDEVSLALKKMLTCIDRLRLSIEEISRIGRQLGSFSGAFTHLSLIGATFGRDHVLG